MPAERSRPHRCELVALSRRNRERGGPCGPAPGTPPCVRVRTRRVARSFGRRLMSLAINGCSVSPVAISASTSFVRSLWGSPIASASMVSSNCRHRGGWLSGRLPAMSYARPARHASIRFPLRRPMVTIRARSRLPSSGLRGPLTGPSRTRGRGGRSGRCGRSGRWGSIAFLAAAKRQGSIAVGSRAAAPTESGGVRVAPRSGAGRRRRDRAFGLGIPASLRDACNSGD